MSPLLLWKSQLQWENQCNIQGQALIMWLYKQTDGRQCSQEGSGPKQPRKSCLPSYSSKYFSACFGPLSLWSHHLLLTCLWKCVISFCPCTDFSSIADSSTLKLEATCFCERSLTFYQIQDFTSQNTVFINC